MREKDFDAVAIARIGRALEENDARLIGSYLVENYSQTVRRAACAALGCLCNEESVRELLDALFRYDLGTESEAEIIKTLSEMLTEEDLEQVRIAYDVSTDRRLLKLYTVLDRCVNY